MAREAWREIEDLADELGTLAIKIMTQQLEGAAAHAKLQNIQHELEGIAGRLRREK